MKISKVFEFLTNRFKSEQMLPSEVVATTQPKTKAKIKKMPNAKTKTVKAAKSKTSAAKSSKSKVTSAKAKSSKK